MLTARRIAFFAGMLFLTVVAVAACEPSENAAVEPVDEEVVEKVYFAPDTADIPDNAYGDLVRYGRQLILHTAYYIGPEGKAGHYLGNKMNCTNCHLDGGTRPYGLNYLGTYVRYPQYRARENRVLALSDRVNNCIERPHNGKPLPVGSTEMKAILSYIQWLGSGIPAGAQIEGDKAIAIAFPDSPLDPNHGKEVYVSECMRCHGRNGEGKMLPRNTAYEYPPLWGKAAYQPGSSMYHIIRAARFIKANMPHDQATWEKPKLSDRDAFDVAAYINSGEHIRPAMKGKDYPDIRQKPIDYPFGPYNDTFSETQHKYGPYKPIISYREQHGLYVNY